MSPSDPRSRIILHMNWKGQALPVLCNGLPSKFTVSTIDLGKYQCLEQPPQEQIIGISPYAQIIQDNYKTPTYVIHGTKDDLIPWQQAQKNFRCFEGERSSCRHFNSRGGGPSFRSLSRSRWGQGPGSADRP